MLVLTRDVASFDACTGTDGRFGAVASGAATDCAAPRVKCVTDDDRLPAAGTCGAMTAPIGSKKPVGLKSAASGRTSPWIQDASPASQGVYRPILPGGRNDACTGNPPPLRRLQRDR